MLAGSGVVTVNEAPVGGSCRFSIVEPAGNRRKNGTWRTPRSAGVSMPGSSLWPAEALGLSAATAPKVTTVSEVSAATVPPKPRPAQVKVSLTSVSMA